MAMSDCEKCWSTPCCCGHEYQGWSPDELRRQIEMLRGVLAAREPEGHVLPTSQPNIPMPPVSSRPTILMWDKPKKVRTVQEWAENYGFEDGPTGGYMPNMSDEDAARWKAKITGKKLGFPQVEIRKTAGAQMTIIVSLGDGYNYKHYKARDEKYPHPFTREAYNKMFPEYRRWSKETTDEEYLRMGAPTLGINVHIALNGPAQLTFEEFEEMHLAIAEAKRALESLSK